MLARSKIRVYKITIEQIAGHGRNDKLESESGNDSKEKMSK